MLNKLVAFNINSTSKELILHRTDIGVCTTSNVNEALEFLMQGQDINLIAWDLDKEISVLLRKLTKTSLIELHKTGKTTYKDHKLFYIQGKIFSITYAKFQDEFKPRNCYHLEQYYPDSEEVTNLNDVQTLGNDILTALKIMGMQSNKLSSAVAIFDDCVLRHITLPTIRSSNIPKEAGMFAFECSGRLWIEAFKLGKIDQCWDWDLSGAFPTFSKDMIDLTDSKWFKDDKFHPEAHYGFCKGYVTIFDNVQVSPIIYTNDKGELSTPTGTWNTYLTKQEIEFIDKWQIGHFEIESGHWCICPNPNKRPLENIANRLLAFKKHENKVVRLLAKRMSVGGLYGKFGEEHKDSFGTHFNPVYFAMISTLCRLEVARFIYEHKLQKSIVHISVDGILTTENIKLNDEEMKLCVTKDVKIGK